MYLRTFVKKLLNDRLYNKNGEKVILGKIIEEIKNIYCISFSNKQYDVSINIEIKTIGKNWYKLIFNNEYIKFINDIEVRTDFENNGRFVGEEFCINIYETDIEFKIGKTRYIFPYEEIKKLEGEITIYSKDIIHRGSKKHYKIRDSFSDVDYVSNYIGELVKNNMNKLKEISEKYLLDEERVQKYRKKLLNLTFNKYKELSEILEEYYEKEEDRYEIMIDNYYLSPEPVNRDMLVFSKIKEFFKNINYEKIKRKSQEMPENVFSTFLNREKNRLGNILVNRLNQIEDFVGLSYKFDDGIVSVVESGHIQYIFRKITEGG